MSEREGSSGASCAAGAAAEASGTAQALCEDAPAPATGAAVLPEPDDRSSVEADDDNDDDDNDEKEEPLPSHHEGLPVITRWAGELVTMATLAAAVADAASADVEAAQRGTALLRGVTGVVKAKVPEGSATGSGPSSSGTVAAAADGSAAAPPASSSSSSSSSSSGTGDGAAPPPGLGAVSALDVFTDVDSEASSGAAPPPAAATEAAAPAPAPSSSSTQAPPSANDDALHTVYPALTPDAPPDPTCLGGLRLALLEAGAVRALVSALTVHASDPAVVAAACGTLYHLLQECEPVADALAMEGGIRAVVQAAATHADVVSVAEPAATTLCWLASFPTLALAVREAGGIVLLANSLTQLGPSALGVAQAATQAFVCLLGWAPALAPAILAANALPAVTAALKAHPQDAALCNSAVSFYVYLSRASGSGYIANGTPASCVLPVLGALQAHPRSATLAESGFHMLHDVLLLEADAGALAAAGAIVAGGGIATGITALQVHSSSAGACRAACSLLASLTHKVPGAAASMLAGGALPLVIAVVRAHAARQDVMEHAIEVLRRLTGEDAAAAVKAGAAQVLLSAVRAYANEVRVVQPGVAALGVMLLMYRPAIPALLAGGLLSLACSVVTRYGAACAASVAERGSYSKWDEEAAAFACKIMSSLALGAGRDISSDLLAADGVGAVVTMLRSRVDRLISDGCEAIASVVAKCMAVRTPLVEAGCVPILVEALHRDSPTVATGAVGALAVLLLSEASAYAAVTAQDCIPQLLHILGRYPENEELCHAACTTLSYVLRMAKERGDSHIVAQVSGDAAVTTVVRTLARHSGVAGGLPLAALSLLRRVLASESGREGVMADAGGIAATLAVLSSHPKDAMVVESGVHLLGELGGSAPDRAAAVVSAGGIDLVMGLLKTFLSSPDVCVVGLGFVTNLGKHPPARAALRAAGGALLVRRIKRTHAALPPLVALCGAAAEATGGE